MPEISGYDLALKIRAHDNQDIASLPLLAFSSSTAKRTRRYQETGFDLIFMDVDMPEMDGRQATRIIRDKGYKDIPIIAMTADVMKEDRDKCFKAGMNDYVTKPIKRDLVFQMVKKWALDKNL